VTLRRLGVGERDVEDVAQEVFVIVHRKLDALDRGRSVQLWLFGICLRAAAGHRRLARHRRQVHFEEPVDAADESPLPDEELAAEQNRKLVLAALDRIDPQRRPVFVMYDLNEFSVAEIAETLSIPPNTVYSRLRVARDEFRQAVLCLRSRGEAPRAPHALSPRSAKFERLRGPGEKP
jgi:RNA polymerase sigma-70 factor (ECF subfamily)